MENGMTDLEWITYCETHCESPRAGFVPANLERIYRLAGMDAEADAWTNAIPHQIISVGPRAMLPLCRRAKKRIQKEARDE